MRTSTCLCGTDVSGEDFEALVDAYLAHVGEVHAELGLTEGNVRDYLEAEERLSDATERLGEIGSVEIHPVTPDRLDDFLAFFDHDAFAGNPAWAGCYCMCHHVEGPEWPKRRAATNRADMCDRIRAQTTRGFLAYADGKPAAWVNASSRSELPEHRGADDHPDDAVGCLVCFVVAPPYRRHGLASRLLDAALDAFRDEGLKVAEAYPRRETQGDAGAYHGPLSLYLDAGFTETAAEGNVVTVQRSLVD